MAATFKDTEGRTWSLALTVWSMERVRQVTGFDLLAALDDLKDLDAITDNAAAFCTMVFVLLADQAEKAKVSDEDFARAIDGGVLDAMRQAMHEAIIDFFHRSKRGPALRTVMEKSAKLNDLLTARAEREAAKLEPETEFAKIEKKLQLLQAKRAAELAKRLEAGASASTPSPASSASIPDPSASGS